MTTDGDVYDLTPVVLENIESMGLDYLVRSAATTP